MGAKPRKLVKKWIVEKEIKQNDWPVTVPLSVDPENGGFWICCELLGEVKGHSKEECIRSWRALYTQARAPELEWEQIIIVKRINNDMYREEDGQRFMYVGFEQIVRIERAILICEVSGWHGRTKTSKKILYRAFGTTNIADGDATTAKGTYGGFNAHRARDRVPLVGSEVLPYNEATWQVLMSMRESLKHMHGQIDALFTGEGAEVAERLAEIRPGRLLTVGEIET